MPHGNNLHMVGVLSEFSGHIMKDASFASVPSSPLHMSVGIFGIQ